MAEQPFLYSVTPVYRGAESVIGRDDIIEKIKSAVCKNQNVSVIGDTKIGKTSLLKKVEFDIRKEDSYRQVIPVYVDFDKFTVDLSVDNLLESILIEVYELNEDLRARFVNFTQGKTHEFSKVIQRCTSKELTVLLILDNFDQITVLRKLDADFWKFLRGNAIEMGLSVITASRSKLETLCHKGDIAGSQFWNIFHPVITLGNFETETDSIKLLSQGITDPEMQELIIENVGNHPCFLKVGANAVIESRLTTASGNIAVDTMYHELRPYYNKCLKLLLEDEKNVDNGKAFKLEYISSLFSLAVGDSEALLHHQVELINLEKLGYVVKTAGGLRIYSPLFSRFLMEQLSGKLKTYEGDKPFVFISYAHEDINLVLENAEELYRHGYRIWLDKDGIRGGEKWREKLMDALHSCHTVLVFLSDHSVRSMYVSEEITKAVDAQKTIIPVHLKELEMPAFFIEKLHARQALKKHEGDLLKRLMDSIHPDCRDQT